MKRSPLRNRSKRKQKEWRDYVKVRDKFLSENKLCHVKSPVCTFYTECVHHKKHRGKYLAEEEFFAATCNSCHKYIHDNPQISYEKGWMIKH